MITADGMMPPRSATIARVDAQHANPKQKWIDLGSPAYPTRQELVQIEQASDIVLDILNFKAAPDGCTFRFDIPAHGIAAITLNL